MNKLAPTWLRSPVHYRGPLAVISPSMRTQLSLTNRCSPEAFEKLMPLTKAQFVFHKSSRVSSRVSSLNAPLMPQCSVLLRLSRVSRVASVSCVSRVSRVSRIPRVSRVSRVSRLSNVSRLSPSGKLPRVRSRVSSLNDPLMP